MSKRSEFERVAFSPGEFASLFGKSQTWGYRQIYAGKVKTIPGHGRILIPAKEVERVLASAGIYNGQEKPKAQKKRLEALPEKERNLWQRFIDSKKRRSNVSVVAGKPTRVTPGSKASYQLSAQSILGNIAKTWRGRKG